MEDWFGNIEVRKASVARATRFTSPLVRKCLQECHYTCHVVDQGEPYRITAYLYNRPKQVLLFTAKFHNSEQKCEANQGYCQPNAQVRFRQRDESWSDWKLLGYGKQLEIDGGVIEFDVQFVKHVCKCPKTLFIEGHCGRIYAETCMKFQMSL